MIERALAEDSDIFFDYSGRELEEKDGFVAYMHLEKHSVMNWCFSIAFSVLVMCGLSRLPKLVLCWAQVPLHPQALQCC